MLEPTPRFNVFCGDNGQGKTNLLETIYVVGALRSFRTQRLAELVAFDRDNAYIGARIQRGGMERVYELTQGARSRKVRLDGKAVRPIAKYFGGFNVVLFAPEDLQIPRGSPGDRRRFVDRAVFNRRTEYLGDVQEYEKIVKSRNALLREAGEGTRSRYQVGDLLDVYDVQLADRGARLIEQRARFVGEMRPRFRDAYEAITRSGVQVDIRYQTAEELDPALGPLLGGSRSDAATNTTGDAAADAAANTTIGALSTADAQVARSRLAEALRGLLSARRPRDLARGTTSVGPHRDDLAFEFSGRAASAFASQGQLRALVLAWKTAEMELLEVSHGEPPVLLLDDVSSELDPDRNRYLFDFLRARRNQCFITTTHPRHVLLSSDRVDYAVASGVVTRQNGA